MKIAIGTSVFIMAFAAFTGAASHFAIGGMQDFNPWLEEKIKQQGLNLFYGFQHIPEIIFSFKTRVVLTEF